MATASSTPLPSNPSFPNPPSTPSIPSTSRPMPPFYPPHSPEKKPLVGQTNIQNVLLGNLLIKPWYKSFYPEELVGKNAERLYVCPLCFAYSRELVRFLGHMKMCKYLKEPFPGRLIYKKGEYEVHEVDGEEEKLFTQNLSLFAKLFLDTKSVFFDVSTFRFYILIQNVSLPPASTSTSNSNPITTPALSNPPLSSPTIPTPTPSNSSLPLPSPTSTQPQTQTTRTITGFFSKEKQSWDNNNLACILIFPPYQRRGLGNLLIDFSYHLSLLEKRPPGGPEKPLSEPGRRAYGAYWCGRVARWILNLDTKGGHGQEKGGKGKKGEKAGTGTVKVSVREISEGTGIVGEDVVGALREMGVVEVVGRDGCVGVNRARVRRWMEGNGVAMEGPVDGGAFVEVVGGEEGG